MMLKEMVETRSDFLPGLEAIEGHVLISFQMIGTETNATIGMQIMIGRTRVYRFQSCEAGTHVNPADPLRSLNITGKTACIAAATTAPQATTIHFQLKSAVFCPFFGLCSKMWYTAHCRIVQ